MANGEKGRSSITHPIGVVSRRTGLKADVLRAWERRYKAIQPGRTSTRRRYYTDEDVERLLLFRQATLAGRRIGQIAELSTQELRNLVQSDRVSVSHIPESSPTTSRLTAKGHFFACLRAIDDLDSQKLRAQLECAAMDLSHPRLIDTLLIPLLQKIGELWEKGGLRVAHEHFSSSVIRYFLTSLETLYTPDAVAPVILVGAPVRQLHEMGALIACVTAASEGWRVTYLGNDLPAEEIAAAAIQRSVSAIALSLVYPSDDPHFGEELGKLRRLVGSAPALLVGGRAAESYDRLLHSVSAQRLLDMSEFRDQLRALRTRPPLIASAETRISLP